MAVLVSSPPPLVIARDKRLVGLGNLNTAGSTKGLESASVYVPRKSWKQGSYLLDVTVDGELTSSQGTDHEETGTDTAE